MLRNRDHELISTIEDWKTWAPPKSSLQWTEGRSGMALARAWTRSPGHCSPPADLEALLKSHTAFSYARIVAGTPEDLVVFDEFSGPRNEIGKLQTDLGNRSTM